jgi:hypothetical protein
MFPLKRLQHVPIKKIVPFQHISQVFPYFPKCSQVHIFPPVTIEQKGSSCFLRRQNHIVVRSLFFFDLSSWQLPKQHRYSSVPRDHVWAGIDH